MPEKFVVGAAPGREWEKFCRYRIRGQGPLKFAAGSRSNMWNRGEPRFLHC